MQKYLIQQIHQNYIKINKDTNKINHIKLKHHYLDKYKTNNQNKIKLKNYYHNKQKK